MATLLTFGETLGVASTAAGTPLKNAVNLHLSTAGAESTVAIGMRRLGHAASWVGVLGSDEIGARVHRDLTAEGVDTRFARFAPDVPTGFMLRDHRTRDYVSVLYYRKHGSGARLDTDDVEAAFAALDRVDLLHVTGITLALSPSCRTAVFRALQLARERDTVVSFDVNYRRALSGPTPADMREVLPHIDVLFVGHDELHLVTDETEPGRAARELLQRGPAEVVVKQGKNGACAAADGELFEIAGMDVTVLDVIGAGDSFVAGYLAARGHGLPIPERLRWGTICAACTVGTRGDWEGLPTLSELESRMEIHTTVR
ncbi:sugar kinase [Actinomadura madurae]|uniref:2-dehydro-3-deoxygluconokinase n=1 Tax=Actinomadura madurae TaxID=1993 RepID=A0A1I5GRS3_9ACTN|nr:sugar kinase [Actinomadura madurae]SFO38633.1 2-dehydro-3-deoxygluconokinase [Actinomadura madurae]